MVGLMIVQILKHSKSNDFRLQYGIILDQRVYYNWSDTCIEQILEKNTIKKSLSSFKIQIYFYFYNQPKYQKNIKQKIRFYVKNKIFVNRTHYTVTPPSDNGFDLQPVPKSRRQASRKDETTLSSAGPHTENPKILVSTV